MQGNSIRRILAVSLLAVLMLTAVAAAFSASPTTAGVAEAATLQQGSSGSKVSEIQQRLKSWGYYSGSVDGISGRAQRAQWCPFNAGTDLPRTASWAVARRRR